jgi:hypothetical protein
LFELGSSNYFVTTPFALTRSVQQFWCDATKGRTRITD